MGWCAAWMHRGTLTSGIDSGLCLVNAREFHNTARQFEHPDFKPWIYAQYFLDALNNFTEEVTDVFNPPPKEVEEQPPKSSSLLPTLRRARTKDSVVSSMRGSMNSMKSGASK